MLKFKYIPEIDIKNIITYARNAYHSQESRDKYLKKQLSLSDEQIQFASNYTGSKLKYQLFKMARIEEEFKYSKIYIAKYDTYLHFKPYGLFAIISIVLFSFIALFISVLSFIYDDVTIKEVLIYGLLAVVIDSIIVLIGLLLKKSFYEIRERLEKDRILEKEGTISTIRVKSYVSGYPNIFGSLLSDNISFLIVGIENEDGYVKIHVPIIPMPIKGSMHKFDMKLSNKFINKKIKIRYYEKNKILQDSNIDFERLCKTLNK